MFGHTTFRPKGRVHQNGGWCYRNRGQAWHNIDLLSLVTSTHYGYAVYHAETARRKHSFDIYCSRNSHWTECVPTPRSAFERVIWYFSTQPNIHRKNLLRRIRSEFQPLEWIEFHAADENSIMYLVFRWARICGNWTFFGMFVALPNAWKWPNCVDLKFETKRERVAFSRP